MTEQIYRLNAYVSEETYRKILDMQMQEKFKTQKKVSQGEIVDYAFKTINPKKGIK